MNRCRYNIVNLNSLRVLSYLSVWVFHKYSISVVRKEAYISSHSMILGDSPLHAYCSCPKQLSAVDSGELLAGDLQLFLFRLHTTVPLDTEADTLHRSTTKPRQQAPLEFLAAVDVLTSSDYCVCPFLTKDKLWGFYKAYSPQNSHMIRRCGDSLHCVALVSSSRVWEEASWQEAARDDSRAQIVHAVRCLIYSPHLSY